GSGVQQDLEPEAEAIRIELFIRSGRWNAPEIDIEHPRKLHGSREGHDFTAILETVGLDDAMQEFGLEVRNDRRQIGALQQAGQLGLRLRHKTADTTGPGAKETVLNGNPIGGTI